MRWPTWMLCYLWFSEILWKINKFVVFGCPKCMRFCVTWMPLGANTYFVFLIITVPYEVCFFFPWYKTIELPFNSTRVWVGSWLFCIQIFSMFNQFWYNVWSWFGGLNKEHYVSVHQGVNLISSPLDMPKQLWSSTNQCIKSSSFKPHDNSKYALKTY